MRLSLIATIILSLSVTPVLGDSFRFVAMGDLPYTKTGDYRRFEALISEVNRRAPAFSVHVGDIKSGSSPCTDQAFQAISSRFDQFDAPLFYTPGDNEWTDCHRKKAGRHDPLERLAKIREMFFAAAISFGKSPRPYVRQSDGNDHKQMVENAIWLQDEVLFATIHIVGSNNGASLPLARMLEFQRRDSANQAWLATAFNEAKRLGSKALVLIFHANPDYKGKRGDQTGFKRTLQTLSQRAAAHRTPILMIHGDTHDLTIDQPLHGPGGKVLKHVTRLEVMGAPQVGAVEVTIDTKADKPFSFDPFTVE